MHEPPYPHAQYISGRALIVRKRVSRPKKHPSAAQHQSTESPGPQELARFEADSICKALRPVPLSQADQGLWGCPQHKAAMRLVRIFIIMTTALADDEKRDWLRIRRTPGVRRAKGERMRGVSMTKGLNPPSKHGWPVDHPTMPRRDDHPGRPLKSRAAHIRRKRGETREKHREKTRRAKAHRDDGALR